MHKNKLMSKSLAVSILATQVVIVPTAFANEDSELELNNQEVSNNELYVTSQDEVNVSEPVIQASDISINQFKECDVEDIKKLSKLKITDDIDGDITTWAVIKHNINTDKAGEYEVTITVINSRNTKVSKKIKVTVNPVLPTIKATNKKLTIFDEFEVMKGVTSVDGKGNDLTDYIIVVENTVDTSKTGEYYVIYKVLDAYGNYGEKKIQVTVDYSTPTISASNKTIDFETEFNELDGIRANDKVDGDLTKAIKVLKNDVNTSVEGVYSVVYQVTNRFNITTEKTISVTVKKIEPKISASNKTIYQGAEFNPLLNVSATDSKGNSLTDKIKVIENDVKTDTPGKYSVTYSVVDSRGVVGTKTITVTVKEAENIPTIKVSNKKVPQYGTIDLKVGLKATDYNGKDLTSKVTIDDSRLDLTKVGEYPVIYKVVGSTGIEVTHEITVSVEEPVPVIKAEIKRIKQYNSFNPLSGVTATDAYGKDLTPYIISYNNLVDVKVPGEYTISYAVLAPNGLRTDITAKVIVESVAPIITAPDKTLQLGENFNPMEDVVATDYTGKLDLTQYVIVTKNTVNKMKAGAYTISYAVLAPNGERTDVVRQVNVVSDGIPVIICNNQIVILKGSTFNPLAYAKACDGIDGDLTMHLIVTKNTVDTNRRGSYKVNYAVLNSSNKRVDKEVTVTVI